MKPNVKKHIIMYILICILVAVDQITKRLAVIFLNPRNGGEDVIIWEGVFRLKYLENRGAAFGLMQGQKVILIVITFLIFLFLCWLLFYRIPFEKRFRGLQGVTIFIMAGAIGNFIDRMKLSYVIDFFYFELINFPIFNVADIYVTCAAAVFILLFLFYYKEEDLDRILPSKKRRGDV